MIELICTLFLFKDFNAQNDWQIKIWQCNDKGYVLPVNWEEHQNLPTNVNYKIKAFEVNDKTFKYYFKKMEKING